MFIQPLKQVIVKIYGQVPLQTVLIVPFVLQIAGAVGLVGYLSYRNGQKAVNDLASQLRHEITKHIEDNLRAYLTIPHQVNQSNAAAIRLGQLNLQDNAGLERHFWQQIQIFDRLTYAGLGLERKDNVGAERRDDGSLTIRVGTSATGYDFRTYSTNELGERTKILDHKSDFDPRTRPWYKAAVAAGKPTWSPIYPHTKGITAYLGASMPFYDKQGKLQGVLLTNINLSQIGYFLQKIEIGKTGQSFIIERDGMLVATSTGEQPFRTKPKEYGAERVKATDSQNALTQATARYLAANFDKKKLLQKSEQLEFKINGEKHFLQVLPFKDNKGLDWLIVVVIPETDFMEQINANTGTTFLLCLVALICAIFMGIITAGWVTSPILHLNAAAKNIAKGDWENTVKIDRGDEVGQLANSFNNMAKQLQESFAEMKTLNQALLASERRLNQFLEALPVGVCVIAANGTVSYVNQTGQRLLGQGIVSECSVEKLTEVYQIYLAGTDRFYPTEQLPAVRALKGETVTVDDMEIHRSGEVIPVEVRSIPIFDDQGKVIYAINVFQDITERKEAEEILTDYYHTLETKVAERTAQLARANVKLEQEIAEREQTEEALRQSEERFRRAFDTAAIGMCLVSLEGQPLAVNPQVCQMFGYAESELLSLSFGDITYPDDRGSDQEYVRELLAGTRPYYHMEKRFLHKNRQTIWARISVSLVRNLQQKPLYFICQIQDITARKEAQQELQKSQARFQKLAANVPGAIYEVVFHPDGSVDYEYMSAACLEIYELEPKQVMKNAQLIYDCIHPDDRESFYAATRQSSKTLEPFAREWRIVTPSGKVKWLQGNSRPERRENGDIVWHGVAIDVSDGKRVEQELAKAKEAAEAANRAKSVFLANMSHELRTPLNAILGFSQLMSHSPNLSPDQLENLGIIRRSGEHLLTLINQVLDLSKIEAGRLTLNEQNFDLYQLLDDVKLMFSLKAKDKGLQLLFERAADVPQYVLTDEVKLREVLINLLGNAMKFTTTGSISVRVGLGDGKETPNYQENAVEEDRGTRRHSDAGNVLQELSASPTQSVIPSSCPRRRVTVSPSLLQQLHFEVEDTGSGIDPDELDKIFEPFVQTLSGQKVREGTGLGLTISRQFVRLMGGEITVSSQVGKGSIFKFDIQASVVAGTEIENKQPKRGTLAIEPNQTRYRLLIVDDQDDSRRLLIKIFNSLGFELQVANNGKAAVEIWSSWKPHLIWMDMRMPVMDGYEATQRIRDLEQESRGAGEQGRIVGATLTNNHTTGTDNLTKPAPLDSSPMPQKRTVIIALTASTFEEERAAALSVGCDDFIRKPFREEEIFICLSNHLGVRYIDAEAISLPVGAGSEEGNAIPIGDRMLTLADLAALPGDWLANLHQATLEGHIKRMQALIEEIRPQHDFVAKALLDLANQYQFEQLLILTQPRTD
ncbi:PAS domain S-box protein [Microseira sp. BLCC-F43]|jgi:PAS domain S-box-containing protein|uniref:PAS domain S-box protein n=1 Tax=Microseira sp. BLCC-F43 TaxID=3153602 RepID=UPI0035B7F5F6